VRNNFFILLAAAFLACVSALSASAMTVVALGDSTTAGTPGFRSPVEKPPAGQGNPESQYAYWLQKRTPGWTIFNKGINGEATREILERFDRDVLFEQPDIVIIMAGVNDLYRGGEPAQVKDNLKTIYDKARKNGMTVAACTILPYDDMGSAVLGKMKEVNAWIREYSGKKGMLFCDTYAAAEHSKKPGKLAGSPDGRHPDVATYKKIGEAIAETLLYNKQTIPSS
jgi:lysophospholipase L1-like esterase